MIVEEFVKLLLSGGAGAALIALLFMQLRNAEQAEKFERERYIAKLERENEQMRVALSETERPTRPIRYPSRKA